MPAPAAGAVATPEATPVDADSGGRTGRRVPRHLPRRRHPRPRRRPHPSRSPPRHLPRRLPRRLRPRPSRHPRPAIRHPRRRHHRLPHRSRGRPFPRDASTRGSGTESGSAMTTDLNEQQLARLARLNKRNPSPQPVAAAPVAAPPLAPPPLPVAAAAPARCHASRPCCGGTQRATTGQARPARQACWCRSCRRRSRAATVGSGRRRSATARQRDDVVEPTGRAARCRRPDRGPASGDRHRSGSRPAHQRSSVRQPSTSRRRRRTHPGDRPGDLRVPGDHRRIGHCRRTCARIGPGRRSHADHPRRDHSPRRVRRRVR